MADEKITLEFDLLGAAQTVSGIGQVAAAVGGIGAAGSIGGIGAGLAAATRLGVFTNALGVAVAALGALASVTRSAADALGQFCRLRDTLGSTSSEAALARVLGGSLGITDIRGLASRARAGISSGLGAAQAAQLGIGPQIDLGRPVNEGRILLSIMMDIRSTYLRLGRDAALLRARNFGLEELVELGTLSRREFQEALREAKEIERTYTPQRIQQARQFNREMERLSRHFERLRIEVGSKIVPAVNTAIENFHWTDLLPGGSIRSANRLRRGVDAQGKDPARALDENSDELRRLREELRVTNGMYGGGPRARGAIPGAFQGSGGAYVSRTMRAHAIRLGAYAVSL